MENYKELERKYNDLKKLYDNAINSKEDTIESKEQIKLITNSVQDAIIMIDNRGLITFWNPSAEKIFGYEKSEVIGENLHKLIAPDQHLNSHYSAFSKFQKTGEGNAIGKIIEISALTKEGKEIDIELSLSAVKIKEEWNSLGVIRDITDRKKSEEIIKESEYCLSRAEKVSKQGNWKLNLNTKEIIPSDGAQLIYGLDKNELTFDDIKNIPLPEYGEVLDKSLNDLITKNIPYNIEFKIKRISDNEIIDIHSIAEYDKKNNIVYGVIQDVTEQKQIESKLKEHQDRLIESQRIAKVGSWFIDFKNNWLNWSKECYSIIEIDENIIGENLRTALRNKIHPEDVIELDTIFKKSFVTKEGFTFEYRAILENSIKIILLISEPILNSNNELIGTKGTIQDITEQKEREKIIKSISEELQEKNEELNLQNKEYQKVSEALQIQNVELLNAKYKAEESERLKSSFLANMSHEIRTPMNGILGFTSLLKDHNLSGEDQGKYINIIEKSGERLLNIINDIINISKIEAGHTDVYLSSTSLNDQLKYIKNFFKLEMEQKNLKFIFNEQESDEKDIINTDKEKLYAILTNLVKNAIKFTNDGSIEIGYKIKNDFSFQYDEEYVEFFVKDTGIGVKKDHQQLIFERFRQSSESMNRQYEGSGLGLTITKAYVEILGGKIWVESEEEKGSTFYFTIPNNSTKKEEPFIMEKQTETPKIKNLKVLIAEDDNSSRLLLIEYIKNYSKDILEAENGSVAIDICKNDSDIDLILMDIQMPLINGMDATQEIRKFNKDIIIIAQSAFTLPGDKEKFINAGCNDYLSKPINNNKLLEMINKYFPNDK